VYPELLDSAWYDVEVWNTKGGKEVSRMLSGSAQLQVFEAPRIWVAAPVKLVSGSVALKVSALGTGPLGYGWKQVNGGSVVARKLGAGTLLGSEALYAGTVSAGTDRVLAGTYRVTVSGPLGDRDWRDISLTADGLAALQSASPAFEVNPQDTIGVAGGTLSLHAKLFDGYELIRWQKANSSGLSDVPFIRTGTAYAFTPQSVSDSGYYYAVASGTVGSGTTASMYSSPALVLVNPADPLYGNTLSAQLRESLASQQQMIVGEGKTATHRAEACMKQKRFDATKIHTHTFPLEDLPTAIRYAKDRVEDAIKVVVKMKPGAAQRVAAE
jgi:hypothetical protein